MLKGFDWYCEGPMEEIKDNIWIKDVKMPDVKVEDVKEKVVKVE